MKTYIQKKIEKLLKENTGKSFLDSGSAYGRHFEKNQKTFLSFNEDIKCDEYGPVIPIHIFMDTMFELNKQTAIFNKILSKDYYCTSQAMDEIGDYCDVYETEQNTYNSDNDLSQDFQFILFECDGENYCVFQLHNGCDIRGGYTSAQVFRVVDVDYFYSWICDFYDNETDTCFESFYSMDNDERTYYDEDKKCWKFEGREIYPYSSAMGF